MEKENEELKKAKREDPKAALKPPPPPTKNIKGDRKIAVDEKAARRRRLVEKATTRSTSFMAFASPLSRAFWPTPNALSPASTAALNSPDETPANCGFLAVRHDTGTKSPRASITVNEVLLVLVVALSTRRRRWAAFSSTAILDRL